MKICRRDNRVLIASDKGLQIRDFSLAKVEIEAHVGQTVYGAAFSPNCSRFVSTTLAGPSETIHISSAADGFELAHRTSGGLVGSVEFSTDGRLVIAGIGEAISIMDANDLKELKRIEPHHGHVLLAVLSPDNRLLVGSSVGGRAFVQHMDTGVLTELDARKENINSATFSEDGMRLVTTSLDGVAVIWDTSNLEQIGKISHAAGVQGATFTKDGRYLLSVTGEGEVRTTALYPNLDALVAHSKAISVRELGSAEKAQLFSLVPQSTE